LGADAYCARENSNPTFACLAFANRNSDIKFDFLDFAIRCRIKENKSLIRPIPYRGIHAGAFFPRVLLSLNNAINNLFQRFGYKIL
jgi:hypothetical protein